MHPIGRSLLLAFGLVAAGIVLRALAPSLVHDGLGRHGVLAFLALGSLVCAVGLPRQAVCFAAGLAWGTGPGTALALAATVAGCTLDFLWARTVARGWARRVVLARSRRLASLDRAVGARPFATVLTLRLLPVGSSALLSLAAGVSRAPLGAFLAATALGALPQTLVFALLGSGVAIGHGVRLALAALLFAASAAVGLALMRRSDAGRQTVGNPLPRSERLRYGPVNATSPEGASIP